MSVLRMSLENKYALLPTRMENGSYIWFKPYVKAKLFKSNKNIVSNNYINKAKANIGFKLYESCFDSSLHIL